MSKYCDVKILQHLGFFCKEVNISRFKLDTVYTFTHKSFMEFFAAKFLAKQKRTRQERKDMAYEMLTSGQSGLVVVFLCGLLKDQNEAVLDIFEIVKLETFLPTVPCDEIGIHDVNENHRGHMIFHCLNEVTPLPKKLGPRLMTLLVDQVSMSYPWCSEECLDGLLKFCDLTDTHCKWCNMLSELKTSLQSTSISKPNSGKENGEGDILSSYPLSKTKPRRTGPPKLKPKPRPASLKGTVDSQATKVSLESHKGENKGPTSVITETLKLEWVSIVLELIVTFNTCIGDIAMSTVRGVTYHLRKTRLRRAAPPNLKPKRK